MGLSGRLIREWLKVLYLYENLLYQKFTVIYALKTYAKK